jgi:membrane-bound lytic murein transglycosylase D
VVRRGDTLSGIAERFGVSLSQLRHMNHLGRVLRIGQRIRLQPRPYYIVRSGDTLSEIAARYHVGISDLRRWNDLGPVLEIGQKIHLRQTGRS